MTNDECRWQLKSDYSASSFRCSLRRCASALSPWFEQLQLGFLDQIVILQNADHLEQVGFLIIPVWLCFGHQLGENGPEGDDCVNPLRAKQCDALLPALRRLGQRRHDQDLERSAVLPKGARGLLKELWLYETKNPGRARQAR